MREPKVVALLIISMSKEFPNTRLSVIEKIRDGNDADRKAALESFVNGYRPALISFLINCKGVNENDAEDCVHDFILNKVMNGKILDLANGKGRFRNLLRVSLQRFLIDSIRKKNREKIVNELEVDHHSAGAVDQTDEIDQIWATALFRSALSTLRAQSPYWDLFVDRILTDPPLTYDQIISRHQYESPEKASNCLITAKRQFNRIIQQCIQEQSHWTDDCTEEELLDEVEFLKQQLSEPLLIQKAIDGLDSDSTSLSLSQADHSIFGDHLVLMEESADSLWANTDLPLIFEHLLHQNIGDFVEASNSNTRLSEVLFGHSEANQSELEETRQLKEAFNQRGKSKQSPLPEKVDVSMTFALICAFVCRGGTVKEITSMRVQLLTRRIKQLIEKEWIPPRMKNLFRQALTLF